MKSINKLKPIPYSKLPNTQMLISIGDTDDFIPDQHQSLSKTLNTRKSLVNNKKSKKNTCDNNSNTFKTINHPQINSSNKNFQTVINDHQNLDNNKRLTHGLTTYKDIKTSHMTNSLGRQSIKNNNRSSSKSKSQLRLDEECLNNAERQAIQCTFTPKTNSNVPLYKNFNEFVNSQQNFLTKRQQKIKKLKKQQIMKQSASIKAIPQIDKKSRKISYSAEEYLMDSYGSLKKIQNKTQVFERLYNIPRKRDRIIPEQGSFIPKILNKSKTLVRNGKVQDLLYEDAQRRKQQLAMKFQQRQEQNIKLHEQKYYVTLTKQNKTNCKLICNKIKNQFIQFLQNQYQSNENYNQYGQELPKFYFDKNQQISPILAVTVISEIFNVQLNPNKNQQLCCKVIDYLISQHKNQTFNQYVQTIRLWEFVKAILGGMLAFQKQPLTLSHQQIINIHQELGYFYSMRLTKQNTKLNDIQIEQYQYKIQTSEKTNRLAQLHRAKKLQKLTQFISQRKIQSINKIMNYKQKNNETQSDEKIIRLQDLFILDQIRKRAQLEQKRIKNEQLILEQCSFRPSLNVKSIQKAKQRKNKSRQHLNTVTQYNTEKQQSEKQQSEKQNIQKSKQKAKKIIIKGKNNENKNMQKIKLSTQSDNKLNLCESIKNVDKTLLRLNIGRKMRDIQNYSKQRGYQNNSYNWLKQTQCNKRKAQGQIQKFLGYEQKTQKLGQKNTENTQLIKQNVQKIKIDIM